MARKPRGWKVWVEPSADNSRCRWRGKYGHGQQTFVFESDAAEFARKKKAAFQRRDAGLPPIRDAKVVLVSGWVAGYLKHRSSNPRQNTYLNFDKPALEQFLEFCTAPGEAWLADHDLVGDTDLPSITADHLYEWKEWLYAAKEYDHTTVRMRGAHLRPALKWAKKRGWLEKNVAEDVEWPKSNNPGRVLTEEEIQVAFAVAPAGRARGAIITLLNSGMRKAEVVTLRKQQVEQLFEQPWRVHFEGRQTKNGKPKVVSLHPAAQAAVAEAIAASSSQQVFHGLTEHIIDYWMKKIQERLGEVRLHDLKHTFCTYWMRDTGDIGGLQQMTGNSLTSLKVYLHLGKDAPKKLMSFRGFVPTGPLNAAEAGAAQQQI